MEDQLQELGLQVGMNDFPGIFSWISSFFGVQSWFNYFKLEQDMNIFRETTPMVQMSVWGCGVIGEVWYLLLDFFLEFNTQQQYSTH